ncbi:MAG: NADPH-dependent assimilatory sulfite reductase hemoprotein subunit [Planctomycetales bacterium]|nr:NADPH-dependent assimilatory sulfite reductase hemoprotein subunit [Planctomycetales bacterium]
MSDREDAKAALLAKLKSAPAKKTSDKGPPKPSAVEGFKENSNFLRGEIAQELVDGKDFFGKGSIQLLKHHGTYQQDNRDDRAGGDGKSGKSFSFMVRTALPGGKLNSAQLLAELDLCEEVGNGTLRITTRQGLQLHGVVKDDLKKTIRRINEVQLTTLAACGDVKRNVMSTPAPYKLDPVHRELQALAEKIAAHLTPRTPAYHEIWLTDQTTDERTLVAGGKPEDIEPIYGKTYLPRKFKIGIGLPGDNHVDMYSQDLGLMAICEDFQIVGYNVLVGGGFGVTPSAKKTYPAVAQPLAHVSPAQVIDVSTAVMKVQRDFGNRSDRKVARLKYTIANMGLDAFRVKVEEYFGTKLEPPRPIEVFGHDDGMGWHEQGDGLWFYGLNVENGRIKDEGDFRLKSALREICTTIAPEIRLTAHQSIIFADVDQADIPRLEEILKRHGVPLSCEISNARRWSMACPALPTCGLAVTESERVLPGIISHLEQELDLLGLGDEVFTLRMTGCPNGCARPYNSDIGLVGKTAGKYTIFLGGRVFGDRLNTLYKDLVPAEEVVTSLIDVFKYFKADRKPGESFGDFCHRKGVEDLLARADAQ